MNDCKGCNEKIKRGNMLSCPNCKTTFCLSCADKTKRICPHCYHSLEFSG